jgi:hypothetical protein
VQIGLTVRLTRLQRRQIKIDDQGHTQHINTWQ